jgi:hypothetical protein
MMPGAKIIGADRGDVSIVAVATLLEDNPRKVTNKAIPHISEPVFTNCFAHEISALPEYCLVTSPASR